MRGWTEYSNADCTDFYSRTGVEEVNMGPAGGIRVQGAAGMGASISLSFTYGR